MLPLGLMAQAPQIISYQAVIRDTTGVLVQNQSIALEFLIIQGNAGNAPSYHERQTALTNSNGLISTSVGQGIVVNGAMSQIDWSNGPFYMVVNIDPLGGSNYWLSTLAEILTVPYALYANRADSADHFLELDPLFQNSIAANITAVDTAKWNAKADSLSEIDPIFISSVAYAITAADTAYWNSKPDSLVEIDPLFTQSIAAGISAADTAYWNSKLDSLTENDPFFTNSLAAQISANDTLYWNNKLDQEIDGDTLNELQNLYLSGDTLRLSQSLDYAIIPPSPDRDTTNEIQTLSINGDTLNLSKANAIILPAEIDADTLNEIQNLTIHGDSISLSRNGGIIVLPCEVDGDTLNEIQNLSVSSSGDTLFLSQSNWIIIPGLSSVNRDTPLAVDMNYQGGLIAYLFQPGDPGYDPAIPHGIIAHNTSIGQFTFGCFQNLVGNNSLYISGNASVPKELGKGIGLSKYNTEMITLFCGANTGANACDTLNLNGYDDWRLPTAAELQQIAMNLHFQGLGNYTNFSYLSSTEGYFEQNGIRDGRCISVSFSPNPLYGLPTIQTQGRSNLFRVIPIRYF